MRRYITWQELGCPTEPGVRPVGVSRVNVRQGNICTANEFNGAVEFELIDTTAVQDETRCYRLGHARPLE